MALSVDKNLCDELFKLMEDISDLLKASSENPLEYKGLEKVGNIARSSDPGGLKNIVRHLDGDFRVTYDNRATGDELGQL